MGIRSLVSFGFLILPIAVTIGILLGLQAYRDSRGLSRPFVSNSVRLSTYCQKAFGIHPDTDGQEYTREWNPTAQFSLLRHRFEVAWWFAINPPLAGLTAC